LKYLKKIRLEARRADNSTVLLLEKLLEKLLKTAGKIVED